MAHGCNSLQVFFLFKLLKVVGIEGEEEHIAEIGLGSLSIVAGGNVLVLELGEEGRDLGVAAGAEVEVGLEGGQLHPIHLNHSLQRISLCTVWQRRPQKDS